MPSPPKLPPPPSSKAPPLAAPPPADDGSKAEFTRAKGHRRKAHRVGIYGPGGIGKSTIASLGIAPRFIDLERGTDDLDVDRVEPPDGVWTWELLRAAVQNETLWTDAGSLVIDTGTKAEELCVEFVLRTVSKYEGQKADSIEAYGFGKGYTHVYEEFLKLLADLDAHVRAGRHVVVLMHDITAKVPNPIAEDFIRYEPRMQSAGKASIRHRVKEWLDHLLFIGYDIAVSKEGKAKGSGSRTIYPQELPWAMAKSRTLTQPMTFTSSHDGSLWALFFPKEK